MMMTSNPYFILMKPNTLKIIEKIWAYRNMQDSNICFTLDAGANVHVLFPEKEKEEINKFIKEELAGFCQNNEYISDSLGKGARQKNSA
jgi:diphosphomevalonate decarboxylase